MGGRDFVEAVPSMLRVQQQVCEAGTHKGKNGSHSAIGPLRLARRGKDRRERTGWPANVLVTDTFTSPCDTP